jgi:hypothetical protein
VKGKTVLQIRVGVLESRSFWYFSSLFLEWGMSVAHV